MPDSVSLRSVIGTSVRRIREEAGLRQDDLARSAGEVGLAWPRSKIATLERGDKAVSAEELVLIALVLRRAIDREVSVQELFDVPDRVHLTEAVEAPARDIGAVLAGQDAGPRLRVRLQTTATEADLSLEDAEGLIRTNDYLTNLVGHDRWRLADLRRLKRDGGEPEARAARDLGMNPLEMAAVSYGLWRRTLTAERDARLATAELAEAAGTVAARRGRVTRTLLEEIRTHLNKVAKNVTHDARQRIHRREDDD